MSAALIETSNVEINLQLAPIEKSWIVEGDPIARNSLLWRSADGTASTIVWECSEGKFDWYYDFEETITILEGSIVLESEGLPSRRYGPGDVIFFKDGAKARWHVEGHVRKLAFCRKPQPALLGLATRAFAKLKRMTMANQPATSLMGA